MQNIKIDSKFADKSKEIMVVELSGHIDQSNSYQLQKMFNNILESGCYKVIIDFGNLYYMSSAGWGVFIGEIKRFRDNGGDIKLANMNADIYDVFQMLEFYHILEDYNTVVEAASSFESDGSLLNLVADNDLTTSSNEMKGNEIADDREEDSEVQKNELSDKKDSTENNLVKKSKEIIDFIPTDSAKQRRISESKDLLVQKLEKTVDLKQLPIQQKIRYIVSENPLLGLRGIRKALRTEHLGNIKIGIFKLWGLLKELDLDNQEKRYRYYRSC